MKVNISRPESWKVVLDIELPQDLVSQEVSGKFSKFQQSVSLPGFRKGKAPVELVKQRFSQQAMRETIEKLVPEAIEKALSENNIKAVNSPAVYDLEFDFEQPLKFKTSVEVKPKINLGSYKRIKIKKKIVNVTNEEVNKQIETLREKSARLVLATHDSVQESDFVVIDYEGPGLDATKDPFKIEKKTNQLIKIGDEGAEKFLPGFTKPLIGAKSGENIDVTVVFPEDHANKKLAAKDACFKVTVQEIKQKQLPELNDDFAKELGLDSIDKLKERINENLTSQQEADNKRSMENQLIDELIKNNALEYPPSLVEQEINYIVSKTKNYFSSQGLTTQQMGIKEEDLRTKCKDDALRNVKTHLILEAISQKENIDISEDEFNQQMQDVINQTKDSADKVKDYFTNYRDTIITQMKQEKTFKFLLDNAKIKDVK